MINLSHFTYTLIINSFRKYESRLLIFSFDKALMRLNKILLFPMIMQTSIHYSKFVTH